MFDLTPWKKKFLAKKDELIGGEQQHPLARMRSEMEALFERFRHDWPALPETWFEGLRGGSLDVEDAENELVVRAETPGFEPDELDVQLSGNRLVIKAEHKEETEAEGARSYQYGSFHRSITLPEGLETDKIDARYHNGLLEVHIPKGERAKAKRISIKTE